MTRAALTIAMTVAVFVMALVVAFCWRSDQLRKARCESHGDLYIDGHCLIVLEVK